MQVNIDYQPAVAQRAGIGRYTRELASHLPPYLGDDGSLSLFYFDFTRKAEAPAPAEHLRVRPFRLAPGALFRQLWKRGLPPRYDAIAGKADVYHFCNFIIPPLAKSAKAIVSIHDMSFMRHPECAEPKNLEYLKTRLEKTVERADAIITISKFSAREIAHFFPSAREKTHVTYLGVDQSIASPGRDKILETRKRLGLERPYILTVGTVEPRKNLPFLVDAFDKMKNNEVDLVVAGRPGWNCDGIFEKFRKARKADRIRHIADVADADLPALYAGAELYATASLYEGFGLTPLEAMLCGTPVISSCGGSLEEVLSDAAFTLRKFDIGNWALSLDGLLRDKRMRGDLKRRGFSRAQKFRWEETARQTAEIYRKVTGA